MVTNHIGGALQNFCKFTPRFVPVSWPFMSATQVFHATTGSLLYQLGDETMPRYPVVSVRFKRDKDDSPVKNILLATCEYKQVPYMQNIWWTLSLVIWEQIQVG